MQKRKELEDSDASINFSDSEDKSVQKPNTLERKLNNLKAKEALMGKNKETIVRDKDGHVTDIKDSKEIRMEELKKLNELIVMIIS